MGLIVLAVVLGLLSVRLGWRTLKAISGDEGANVVLRYYFVTMVAAMSSALFILYI